MILSAIEEYKKLTCLKFTPKTSSDADYIYFTNGNTGCWSSVGKIGGRQEVYYFIYIFYIYVITYTIITNFNIDSCTQIFIGESTNSGVFVQKGHGNT